MMMMSNCAHKEKTGSEGDTGCIALHRGIRPPPLFARTAHFFPTLRDFFPRARLNQNSFHVRPWMYGWGAKVIFVQERRDNDCTQVKERTPKDIKWVASSNPHQSSQTLPVFEPAVYEVLG